MNDSNVTYSLNPIQHTTMRFCLPPSATALLVLLSINLLSITSAWAGRPLSVDDANVNDAGNGHVETWVNRAPGSTVYNIAPAFAIKENLEISATLSRESQSKAQATAIQAKYRISPSNPKGCNTAVAGGVQHANQGGASSSNTNTTYVYGALSCNTAGVAIHANLGLNKPSGDSSRRSWGVAVEREIGAVTAHAEYFGQQGNSPTAQIGLRGDVAKGIQLDGTMGRNSGENVYSLGMKFSF